MEAEEHEKGEGLVSYMHSVGGILLVDSSVSRFAVQLPLDRVLALQK